MPTSNKTPELNLNNWLGTDKPMRSDFTEDNLIFRQRNRRPSSGRGGPPFRRGPGKIRRPIFDRAATPATGRPRQALSCPLCPSSCLCFIRPGRSVNMWRTGTIPCATPGSRLPGCAPPRFPLQGNKLTVKQTTGEVTGKLFHNLNRETASIFIWL